MKTTKFGLLSGALLIGTLASAPAHAFSPVADCDGWSVSLPWCSPSYLSVTATLEKLDGSVVTIDVSGDTNYMNNGYGVCGDHINGALWGVPPGAGTFRVTFSATLYNNVNSAPASEADLAEWPGDMTFFYDSISSTFDCEGDTTYNGARTPGYWKNHPEAWGATTISVGGQDYSQECLLDFFDAPTRGDVRVILIHHLVAAKLNLLPSPVEGVGSTDPSITPTIEAADAYLAGTTINCGDASLTGPKPTGEAKGLGVTIKDALDAYNNNVDSGSSALTLESEESAGGCNAVGGETGLVTFALPLLALALIRRRRS